MMAKNKDATAASATRDDPDVSALECPVCLDVWKGSILKCQNGHIICVRCINKLPQKKCPTCRQGRI